MLLCRETLKAYGVCESSRFRPEVAKLGQKQMFPFLVDDNTNTKMYDSDAIVAYLWATYGNKVLFFVFFAARLNRAPF